jgi:hypothetical protein
VEHGSGGDEEWICRRCCLLAWPWPPLIWKDREIMRGRVSIPLAPNELEEAWSPDGGQCHICRWSRELAAYWNGLVCFYFVLFGCSVRFSDKIEAEVKHQTLVNKKPKLN